MFTYKSLLTSLFYTFFLYSSYYGFDLYFLNTIVAIAGIMSLFLLTKKELFTAGFFIAILWFWWMGYSFIYYELSFLIPLVLLAIGILYGILYHSPNKGIGVKYLYRDFYNNYYV